MFVRLFVAIVSLFVWYWFGLNFGFDLLCILFFVILVSWWPCWLLLIVVFICLLFAVIVLCASFVVLFDFILRCVWGKLLWL